MELSDEGQINVNVNEWTEDTFCAGGNTAPHCEYKYRQEEYR